MAIGVYSNKGSSKNIIMNFANIVNLPIEKHETF
jgi:hypothetical protein